jgi:hypothetical protein
MRLAYRSSSPITPGTTVRAGDGVCIACSVAGFVRLLMQEGSYLDVYAQPGTAIIDNIAVIGVDAANTTATAKVAVLRQG